MTRDHRLIVTDIDMERLERVVEQHGGTRNAAPVEQLEAELARAEVTPSASIAPDVVTMNSSVVFEDEETGEQRTVTLVYPQDARNGDGRVSVLAPIGSALLGLSVGQTIEWPLPGDRTKRLRIVAVPYQPEAAGHFHL
ncbi:nucleoside diphosphate kinase regulator [Corallococcus sp. H22C18031201]|uniref:nucleoside diphosphate kinase regulator n=1 Tax=Citreicoccus inhibens TaxID=2849499 RepID=UPI000E72D043|nr:nucleoside diphosphate kinase regulator [Citreicoccus inhibens]MBJ6760607.1 nucleoside diphosphate kinase regulator [Myxococcaceae bacterium JPH2]MBU8900947.1 nucleoside diphosphate kinase regulator [Citreicoccus inhibens]RJS19984.1 nucleoside diphosphate kinase regulator [Corallococcus sp. H22C18031201]